MTFISGINPKLGVTAEIAPLRGECGIGAMMPWAGKLWFVTFVGHTGRSGAGTGLYTIDEDLRMEKHPASVVGTYANRWIHSATDLLVIGPHLVDVHGNVRTIPDLVPHRLTASMDHHEDVVNKVSYVTMEGLILELDLRTLEVKTAFNMLRELDLPEGTQPHFKAGFTLNGHIIVGNNTYDERDHKGQWTGGLLAEYDGKSWKILEKTGFMEVFGRRNLSQTIFAIGWDKRSAILRTRIGEQWTRYRLPKASSGYEYYWSLEWTRIREMEHERIIIDASGMFYEISPVTYEGRVWGLRPISTHLRVVPDFTIYRGMLVMGGNQISPNMELDWWRTDRTENEGKDVGDTLDLKARIDNNPIAGEPQTGLWFGAMDDLWTKFGKPKGWGGVWWEDKVKGGEPSDPFLMTGFERKSMHLSNDSGHEVKFRVEVDFLGNGTWKVYDTIAVGANGYVAHAFPEGFNAHWIRLTADKDCVATGYFHYT